ncbi:MAG: hypothetical protein IPN83_07605 [Holophagales bacterium]|nr:hypothetical protein [Holophagales bacterium]
MRAARLSLGISFIVLGAAGAAGAEPPPTPAAKPESAPQHVTAPSLPGQQNREGTVRPDGSLPMDSEGYAVTTTYDGTAPSKASPRPAPKGVTVVTGSAAGVPARGPNVPIGPAPTGKGTTTGANYITVSGSVVALEPGKSVTIRLQRTGVENTYKLAPGATVGKGVSTGKLVRVRVLAAEKGKVADKVDVVPPLSPTRAN